MTDEQFQKLMDKLEEIRRAQVPMYVGYPIPPQRPYDPLACYYCGRRHSLGACPSAGITAMGH